MRAPFGSLKAFNAIPLTLGLLCLFNSLAHGHDRSSLCSMVLRNLYTLSPLPYVEIDRKQFQTAIDRVRKGDLSALNEIFSAQYAAHYYRLINRSPGRDPHLVMDMLQLALIDFYLKTQEDPKYEFTLGWFLVAAQGHLHYRTVRLRHPFFGDFAEPAAPAKQEEPASIRRHLAETIEALTGLVLTEDAEIYQALSLQGISVEDLVKRYGGGRIRICRIIRRVHRILEEVMAEESSELAPVDYLVRSRGYPRTVTPEQMQRHREAVERVLPQVVGRFLARDADILLAYWLQSEPSPSLGRRYGITREHVAFIVKNARPYIQEYLRSNYPDEYEGW